MFCEANSRELMFGTTLLVMKALLMAKFPCCNSHHQQRNLDQRIIVNPPSSCKRDVRMGCVRTHPPMTKLVFWKLLENRDFLWECCSVIFVKDVYPFAHSRMFIPCCLSLYCLWLIASIMLFGMLTFLRASLEFIYE